MADVMNSLFGVTPESLMAQREAALAQQATNYAQLSPMQASQAGFYTAGNRLAGAAGGLLGAQDPEMMRIQQRQQMLQGLDLSSPESLKQGIQTAMQNKDYQLVSELTNRYQATAKAGLEARKTAAEIAAKLGEKLTPEQKNAAGLADAAGLTRGTQEWQDAYAARLGELTTKPEKTLAFGTDAERLAKGVFGKSFNQLTPQEAARVDAELEKRNLIRAQASRQTINLPPQEKAEQGKRGEMLVDQYKDVSKQAAVAARTLPALESSLNIMDKGFDTGFGTEALATGAKVLAALGVEDAKSYATNAQSFLGAASQAVLTRQLEQKGPQTESDAARITQTGAQLGNTKEANRFLVSVAKAQFKRDLAQRSFYDEWFKSNKTYDGAEDAWFKGEGGKSLFDAPDLKKYKTKAPTADQIPSSSSASIPQAAIDALKAGKGTDAQFDAIFGQGAAKRIKGK